jgi:YD repeat-containing protein
VVFNSARTHSFVYDGLDNLTSETHPETGVITYYYDTENRLSQKTWGGIMHTYSYNAAGQLICFYDGEEWISYEYDDSGRVNSISSTKGWSRKNITYSVFGSVTGEVLTIPGLPSKSLSYTYDTNNNQSGITYPDGKSATTSYNGLNMPESSTFNSKLLVSDASYGPNMMPTSMTVAGNGTSFTATYSSAGLLNRVTLKKDSTALSDASYTYDGVGNIISISSTAPAPGLSASFGYDSLNRLTSATYSSGRVSNFVYEFDEYGNMKTVKENGATVFSKTYDSSNRINGYDYDARGNLTSAGGNIYSWDKQNRLNNIKNTAGAILGKYIYDERGLRLMAVPPTPEININHDGNSIPDGGCTRFSCSVGSYIDQTFTIENLGDANLILSGSPIITISGPNANQFSVQQQPASPVSPSQTTTFKIRFQPTSPGIKTAAISIANNDMDENPYDITLYGNFEPEIYIWQAPDGGSWDFGTIKIGDFWQETFTIQNVGNDNLTLSGSPIVSITGPDWDQFSVEQQPGSLISPGGTTTFVIRFSPTSEGPNTAAISIANNDWNENPYDIMLLGTGQIGLPIAPDVPSFTVTYPNGGEEIQAGSVQTITWKADDAQKDVKIEYSADNGSTYQTIIERTPNTGSYQWKVPQDISPSCLIRISNSDGYPIMPVMLTYEFNFKISKVQDMTSQAAHFMIHAGVPDVKTLSSWVADISFVPDELQGNENMLFNYVQAEFQSLELFFENWHHVRIQFDLNNYSGSAWIDDRIIVENVPLRMGLNADSPPEISMSCGVDMPVEIWIEDLEVKLLGQSLKAQNEEEELIIQPIIRDNFDKYEIGLFPAKGGWLTGQEMVNRDKRNIIDNRNIIRRKEMLIDMEAGTMAASPKDVQRRANAIIDDKEYVFAPKSFKLESPGGRQVSVVKR